MDAEWMWTEYRNWLVWKKYAKVFWSYRKWKSSCNLNMWKKSNLSSGRLRRLSFYEAEFLNKRMDCEVIA